MLANGQLESLRGILRKTLVETAVVERCTVIPDGHGGQAETWAMIGTYPGRIGMRSGGAENEIASTRRAQQTLTVTLPHNADAGAKDRITIRGRTYEIVEPVTEISFLICKRFRVRLV